MWIVGSLVGGVLLIIGLGYLFVVTGDDEPVTARDLEVLVDIDHLAEWMDNGYVPEERAETVIKTRYIDGSYDLEYTYEESDSSLYLYSSVTVEQKISDAHTSYLALWGGFRLGWAMGDDADVEFELVERNDMFEWGDQSRFGLMMADGSPVGNFFITRVDKNIFFFTVVGVFFDSEESFRGLVRGPLTQMESYRP